MNRPNRIVRVGGGTFTARRSALGRFKELEVDTNSAWSATNVGSGSIVATDPLGKILRTGATANSSTFNRTRPYGLNGDVANRNYFDYDKALSLFFSVCRYITDAEAVSRVQMKDADGIGVLGEKGIGLQLDNLALTGEAYGASRGTVDLSTSLTIEKMAWVEIRLTSTGVEFFVDNVSKGSITTADKFPTGDGAAAGRIASSHANGGTGTNSDFEPSKITVLQEL
ncbi:hypothetical protein LCGC14_0396830 [marine sediment metagenome]|uniref:Uncharacterized protein n=1 Tax=marine sediment metagenome TaxID=412755 RepID=A0A0F9VK60_9ZZZZ